MWETTYSHIYGAEGGEVDFADAIMQRRILVVLLPSLEKAPAELASLGKISLSVIRNACAVGLGANIEGDAADVLEALPTDTMGIGPYLCIVDEYAAIVTPGFEAVLTQGRGLVIAAIVASQDYAGIFEVDKKGAQQMVANTSIKVFMKMQDADFSGEIVEYWGNLECPHCGIQEPVQAQRNYNTYIHYGRYPLCRLRLQSSRDPHSVGACIECP